MCGKKDNLGAPGTPGCSHGATHVAFTNLLRKLAWVRLHLFSYSQPIATGDFVERAAHVVIWMRVGGKLGGFAAGVWTRGRRCAFAGGSVWTSLDHLVGLTPVRNKSETQCYHDLRRPGSAVRMFMRPFVWAKCAQHIHVNVLPGCFQISRANLKRVRPRNTLAPFVRVRCAAQRTIFDAAGTPGCSHGAAHVAVAACHERPPRQSRSQAVSACHERPPRQSRSRAVSACHKHPPRQSPSRAVSACHERPPRQSRSGAVCACHERPPRQSRSRAVSACHERPPRQSRSPQASTAPVSLAGGFRLSRASTAPVSLAGGFRLSRASTAPVSLAGGFRLSRASTAPVSLAGGFRLSRASTAPVSLAGGFRMSRASTAPVSLAGGFRMSRASTAPVSLAGGFGAQSAPHRRPPASQTRLRAVSSHAQSAPPQPASLARGQFPASLAPSLHHTCPSQPHTAVPASLVRPVCTPTRHRTPGLQHNEMEIPSYLRRHSLYRSQAP